MSRSQQFAIIWCRAYNPVVVSAVILSLLDYLHLLLFPSLCPLLIFHFVGLLSWLTPVLFRYRLWKSWWFMQGWFWISPRSSAVWCLFFVEFFPVFWPLFFVSFLRDCAGVFSMTTEGAVIGLLMFKKLLILSFPQGPSPFYCLDFCQGSSPFLCLGIPLIRASFVSGFRKICPVHWSPFY